MIQSDDTQEWQRCTKQPEKGKKETQMIMKQAANIKTLKKRHENNHRHKMSQRDKTQKAKWHKNCNTETQNKYKETVQKVLKQL